MPNRLLERLGADYSGMVEQYETILNRCADEQRDPNEAEQGLIDGLRANMEPLGERIVQLRSIDDQRMATVTALTTPPDLEGLPPVVPGESRSLDANGHPIVHVRSEELVYNPPDARGGERVSFFRDLFMRQMSNDSEARSRLERHDLQMRAAATSATGAGIFPPTWLFSEFAALARGARPTADTFRNIAITDANPVTIGVQATPGANVPPTGQGGENVVPPDGSFNATQYVVTPTTMTGKVDVSRQLLDGSNPAVDGLVYADCMGAYNEAVETMIWTALDAMAGAGLASVITVNLSTGVSAAFLPDAIVIAGANVRGARKSPPTVVLCSENMWGNMNLQKDSNNRPLIVTGYQGPMNARGIGEAVQYGHVAGNVVGLPVVPSWAGTDNMYVSKADDVLLLESGTFNFRYEEVLGPESIRLGVWGYAAIATNRYPKGFSRITVTPPTAGGLPLIEGISYEVEPEPVASSAQLVTPQKSENSGTRAPKNGGTT